MDSRVFTKLIELLTEMHTFYVQRDDPNGANWCMRVIAEAKELEKL